MDLRSGGCAVRCGLGLILGAALLWQETAVAGEDPDRCPILDTPAETVGEFSVGYAPAAATTATSWDDVSVVSLRAWSELGYIEKDWGADFSAKANWDSLILQGCGDTASSGYPLAIASLALRYSQRFVNGYGLRLDAQPGIYSTLNGSVARDFRLPFGIIAIKAFDSNRAAFVGVGVYPGFDQTLDPRLGLRWHGEGSYTVDLAYPETRLTFQTTGRAQLYFGARYLAWPEYGMGEDDERETLFYREGRGLAGVDLDVSECTRLTLEGGYLFSRTLDFEASSPKVEMDDTGFVSVALSRLL